MSAEAINDTPAAAAGSETHDKLSLLALTAMVVGSMVGAGVFQLPARFATQTGVYGALIAWTIAGVGMLTVSRGTISCGAEEPAPVCVGSLRTVGDATGRFTSSARPAPVSVLSISSPTAPRNSAS